MDDAGQVRGKVAPVSVVIPCFRSADVIRRALDSAKAQTLQPMEVIVVDDCSQDGTLEALNSLLEDYGASWLKVIGLPENGGPGTARNAGWNIARGEYVAFLDADDAWHPQKLEVQFQWMNAHPDVALTGHPCTVVEPNYQPKASICGVEFRPVRRNQLFRKNYFSTQTVMVKRDIEFRFRAGKRYSEDYMLACEICCSGLKCATGSVALSFLFKDAFGAGGLSGDLWKMEKGELEVFRLLYAEGHIGVAECMGFSLFSLSKFVRRTLLVGVRKFRG